MQKIGLFLVFFITIFSSGSQAQNSITVDQYDVRIKDSNVVVLDVRTSGEFNTGHIKNALQADWTNRVQFDDRTQYLDKNKTVYVYCQSGGRSNSAAEVLRKQGYTVVNLDGGLTAWKKAGKPVDGLTEENKISNDQYLDLINSSKLVMVDFGASWCPPCKKMEPIIENIKKTMTDKVSVIFVDGGSNTSIMENFHVDALPTFIIYQKGKEVWRKQGVISQDEMVAVINKYQ